EALFRDRFVKPLKAVRRFFANPCEAPRAGSVLEPVPSAAAPSDTASQTSPIEIVRALVAEHLELPAASVRDEARLLADLHLNSIAVAQLAAKAARRIGVSPPTAPLDYSGLTVADMATALESGPRGDVPSEPA